MSVDRAVGEVQAGEPGGVDDVADETAVAGAVDHERLEGEVSAASLSDGAGGKVCLERDSEGAGRTDVAGGGRRPGTVGDAGVGHAGRGEHDVSQHVEEWLADRGGDDLGQHEVAEVGVVRLSADRVLDGAVLGEQAGEQRRRVGRATGGGADPADGERVGEPGRVVEELADRGPRSVLRRGVGREVVADGRVEVESAAVGQCHGRSSGGDLGQGEPQVGRVRRCWAAPVEVGPAGPAGVQQGGRGGHGE